MNRRRVIIACLTSLLFPFLLIVPALFAELINDGSFENDPSAWEEYFATPCTPSGIGDWSAVTGAPESFDGEQTLWVGGVCNTTPPILRRNGASQTISLQENAAVLSFWFNPVKSVPDPLNLDRAIVTIDDEEVWSQDVNGITDPIGWNNALVDISQYANQPVTLALEIRQNVDLSVANVFFDAIEILHPSVEISQLLTLANEDTLLIEVTIENAGDTELNNLTVTNNNFTDCNREAGNLPDTAPGESTTYTCAATNIDAEVENTAAVQATATEIEYPVEASHTASFSDSDVILTLRVEPIATSVVEGDSIDFTFTVTNNGNSALENLQISSLEAANCNSVLALLAGGQTAVFNCTYTPGQSGTLTFTATASEPISGREVSAVTAVTIELLPVVPPSVPGFTLFIPLVTYNFTNHNALGEPNDVCSQAFPLTVNQTSEFLAEDIHDWYLFTLDASSDLTITLDNFVPIAGQITVWQGTCQNLTFVAQNGDFTATKSISLTNQPPGSYYIWIINDGPINTTDNYTLSVLIP